MPHQRKTTFHSDLCKDDDTTPARILDLFQSRERSGTSSRNRFG